MFVALAVASAHAQVDRAYDGSGNNLAHPAMGSTDAELIRWAAPAYADSVSAVAAPARRNPREVSNILFAQGSPLLDDTGLSDFCWVFGQFLDHDITLTVDGAENLFIPVPRGDVHFDPFNTGNVLIPMRRSLAVAGTGDSPLNPRQHANAITAFVDGSNVYGSDQGRADWLRTFSGGKLKTSPGGLLPYNTLDLTADGDVDPAAPHMDNANPYVTKLFVAGDVRANENVLLLTLHTLFLREHNRLCDVIAAADPSLDDEAIYQRARKLNGAIMQSIVYREWLPAMGVDLPPYAGYDPTVDASIANEFAAAAFRMGHTLLSGVIRRLNPDGTPHPDGHLSLKDAFFNPAMLAASGGLEPFVKGMAEQTQQSFDARLVDDVRNFLFGPPGRGGLDLAAINIMRGRERGLPDYNALRQALGLPAVAAWSDVVTDPAVIAQLDSAYAGPGDADAWVGMLAEDAMPGKLFGPTVTAALTRQFAALRDGDRYFYLNDTALDEDLCAVVGSTRLSDVIRRNTDVDIMQGNVFTSMPHTSVPACTAASSSGDLVARVALPDGTPLDGASLRIYGTDDYMPRASTSNGGLAAFAALPTCDDYEVAGEYNGAAAAGLTTYDLYLIGQHILGNEAITEPLRQVAADANASGNISAFDMTVVRRVLLGLDTAFLGADAWVLYAADSLPGPGQGGLAYPYAERVALPRFSGADTARFVAVKRGDINGSVAAFVRPRSSLPLTAEPVAGGLRVLPSIDGALAEQYELRLPRGYAVTAVEGLEPAGYRVADDGRRVRVVREASRGPLRPFVLRLAPGPDAADLAGFTLEADFPALTYAADGRAVGLRLSVAAAEVAALTRLTPNPAADFVRAYLPEAWLADYDNLSLTLYAADGRMLGSFPLSQNGQAVPLDRLPGPPAGPLTWVIEGGQERLDSGILLRAD